MFLIIELINYFEQGYGEYFKDLSNFPDYTQIISHSVYLVLKIIDYQNAKNPLNNN